MIVINRLKITFQDDESLLWPGDVDEEGKLARPPNHTNQVVVCMVVKLTFTRETLRTVVCALD